MTKASKAPQDLKPAKRPKADWQAIERDYRTGRFTDQELADKHKNVVTRQAVNKRAKTYEWTKDLSAAVRQATRAKVIQAQVAQKVATQVAGDVAQSCTEATNATTDAVLVAAEISAQVILRHQSDLKAARQTAMAMLAELDMTTNAADAIRDAFNLLAGELEGPAKMAAQQRFNDFMRLHNRVASVHKLADTLNKLQDRERIAFSLDAKEKPGDEFEDMTDDELDRRIAEKMNARNGAS